MSMVSDADRESYPYRLGVASAIIDGLLKGDSLGTWKQYALEFQKKEEELTCREA